MGCFTVLSDNWIQDETPNTFVSSTATGFPYSNLIDSKRYRKWRSASSAGEYILWDLGIPSVPKAFAAISDRNKPLKLSPSATVKLQANPTDNFANPAFERTVPFRDYVLALTSDTGLSDTPYRYWRLTLDDPANPYGYIELGEIFLGDSIQLSRGCAIYPFTNRLTDSSTVFTSEGGQVYTARGAQSQELQVEWRSLLKEEFEELEAAVNYFGLHKPFFMAFDEFGSFSTQKETWVRFVRFKDTTDFQLGSFNNFGMTFGLREEL